MRKQSTSGIIALIALTLCLPACRTNNSPAIEFTRVPDADEGGPVRVEILEGRVVGARPGQHIVIYAKGDVWWVQPTADHPFTNIQRDGRWSISTHLGTSYAALLVDPGFEPQTTLLELPARGGTVIALKEQAGRPVPARPVKTLQFSGYEWEARRQENDRGGTPNLYDPANAWTDDKGYLHLRIAGTPGHWTCAEVSIRRSFGYGSYVFVTEDISALEPGTAFSMLTWDPSPADQNHRELDIEISRWGNPSSKNAQFVVQPYTAPANVARFDAPSGVLTHSFRWEANRAAFKTVRGSGPGEGRIVARHEVTSGVPAPGGENVRLNLYVFGNNQSPMTRPAEVVVRKFEYLP